MHHFSDPVVVGSNSGDELINRDLNDEYRNLQKTHRDLCAEYELAQEQIHSLTRSHSLEIADLRARIELLQRENQTLEDQQELWRSVVSGEFTATQNNLRFFHSRLRLLRIHRIASALENCKRAGVFGIARFPESGV
jgi:hypothetical protein